MVEGSELEQKSKEFGIHVANVQRDYVLGWLLFAIFNETALKDILFLKGGNALRKCYFPETRFSADIDLGTPRDIGRDFLIAELIRACVSGRIKVYHLGSLQSVPPWRELFNGLRDAFSSFVLLPAELRAAS